DALQHRLPVTHGKADLSDNALKGSCQFALRLLVHGREMKLYQADALDILGRSELRSFAMNDELVLFVRNIENRMHEHEYLPGMHGQVAHDGIDQNRLVAIDDRNDADGAALPLYIILDADDGAAPPPALQCGIGGGGRFFEGLGAICSEIFRWRPFKQKLRESSRNLGLPALLFLPACLGTFCFARSVLLCSQLGYSCYVAIGLD